MIFINYRPFLSNNTLLLTKEHENLTKWHLWWLAALMSLPLPLAHISVGSLNNIYWISAWWSWMSTQNLNVMLTRTAQPEEIPSMWQECWVPWWVRPCFRKSWGAVFNRLNDWMAERAEITTVQQKTFSLLIYIPLLCRQSSHSLEAFSFLPATSPSSCIMFAFCMFFMLSVFNNQKV